MQKLSQNRKIAVSAIAIFIVSFSFMLFFLESNESDLRYLQADIARSVGQEDANIDTVESGKNSSGYIGVESAYRAYLGNTPDPIFVTNADGTFRYASDEFCELIDLDCSDVPGSQFFDYINIKDLSSLVSHHTKLIQNGEKIDGIGPFRMIHGDREKLVLFSAKPITNREGKVSAIAYSAKDLTEQVEELKGDGGGSDKDAADEGATEDGATEDGAAEDGAAEEGAAEDGATEDGATEDGATEDGATEDGATEENWIDNLYPKIKDMGGREGTRLMVDKVR